METINENLVSQVFHEYNPWWNTNEFPKEKQISTKRPLFFEAMKLLEEVSLRRFLIISGMRRVGKTTILEQIIEELIRKGIHSKNILYISFDNLLLKTLNINNVIELYETFFVTKGKKYFFFDEIHATDDWNTRLKVLYDMRTNVEVVATGSASPVLSEGNKESGTGRWTVLKLPTLSFYEYCKFLNLDVNLENVNLLDLKDYNTGKLVEISSKFVSLQSHFNRYLTIGGFPELISSNNDTISQKLLREDIIDKVIKKDLFTIFKIRNPISMEKLFLYLCINSSDIFNAETASKELNGISKVTIEEYLEFLERANLIYISNPTNVGTKSVLKGKPKIYVADPAIRNAVLMTSNIFADPKELGKIVETLVYKHLNTVCQKAILPKASYCRESEKDKEVDVVIDFKFQKQYLFEVKYKNNSKVTDSDLIVKLSKDKDSKVLNSFLVTKSLDDFGVASNKTYIPIFKIPAIVLLYILGKMESENTNFNSNPFFNKLLS